MLGLGTVARKVFGTANDRKVKATRPLIEAINALEEETARRSDAQLIETTAALKARVADGEALDDLLPEAFANCREAARRALGLRAFDVQLMGGIFLHQGNIAEMKTGEGKTLVATFPAYLNALTGRGVHIVTVNDYLARRDADWMGKVYGALGLTTGVVVPQQPEAEKRTAYGCDITYATNNELGFDYLRDNMKQELAQMMQRGHAYAIVDEVDSILIDEARTPLIISGPSEDRSELYVTVDKLIPEIEAEHFTLDEKQRNVTLTDAGNEFMERRLRAAGLLPDDQSLYDPESTTLVHHVTQAPARAQAVHPRQGLHRAWRRGGADRRIHRPDDAGPPAVRRAAPGDRGQGIRAHPAREHHPRLDHLPELFPALRQACRDDRDGGDRSRGVSGNLRAWRGRGADQPARRAGRRTRPDLPHRAREIRRHRRRDQGCAPSAASRCWSAQPRSRSRNR
jgi:hypothetical protein